MKLAKCSLALILTGICCLRPPRCAAQIASTKPSEATDRHGQQSLYEAWIRDYGTGPLRGALGIEQREIKLVITVVEGDDLEADPKTASIMGPSYRTVFHGCAVSIDGKVS